MKKIFIIPAIGFSIFLFSTIQDAKTFSSGKTASSGAPGEATCSQSGCHGAGDGGLADNGAKGKVTFSSSNMTNWAYEEGKTYTITLVNSDLDAKLFGICVSVLNNLDNKSAGSFVLTNTTQTKVNTRTISGSSRSYLIHNGASGSGTFTFDWTAPIGVNAVTFYYTSNAANGDGVANADDNIYSGKQVATLATITNIEESNNKETTQISLYPNPAKGSIQVKLNGIATTETQYTVYSMDGMKMTDNITYKPGAYLEIEGWNPGKYFLQMNLNGKSVTKTFIVE
jgi:hypothetical protein